MFNALFELLNKNPDLLDCISLCLLNSLKNKQIEEINILVNWNLKKFENLIINNNMNSNMIKILDKATYDIFENSEILKSFVFFTIKLRNIKITDYIDSLIILSNQTKICEYHIKIIEDNLEVNGCFFF